MDLKELDPDDLLFPCGLMTTLFPNDSFESIENMEGQQYKIKTDKIWDGNKNYEYFNADLSKQWLNVEDPRFFVWMKKSSISGAAKLWGVLDTDLVKGDYYLYIDINYDASIFGGKKKFIITGNTDSFANTNYLSAGLFFILATSLVILAIMLLRSKVVWERINPNNKKK